MSEKKCICLECLYHNQPYGYFPIVCVQGKHIKEYWHEIYNCKHFEQAPNLLEQVIHTNPK